MLATGSHDSTARVTDIKTGQTIRIVNHEKGISSVAISNDGYKLATGSNDKKAKVIDILNGNIILD